MTNTTKSIIRHLVDCSLFFFNAKKYYYKNFEKIDDYYLRKDFYKNRKAGLSVMMRIKNDEKWIFFAIQSIIEYVDEIVIVLQNCNDKTEEIVRSFNSPKIKIYQYPFDSFPSSKYHKNYLKNSIFNRAYYYNYALSLTNYSYVWKWDGDHAAFEDRVAVIRNIVDTNTYDIIHFFGIDLFGKDLKYTCKSPYCSNEPWIFKVNRKTFYLSGKICEEFSYPQSYHLRPTKIYNFPKPLFIHFKYASDIEDTRGWITTWEKEKHFSKIMKSKSKGEPYIGEYPKVVQKYYFNIS